MEPVVQPSPPAPTYVRPWNGLAIASLVLGIVWIFWIGSLLAIIFGLVAIKQIDRSNGWQQGKGMAIAGTVLGFVGAATFVVAILTAVAAEDEIDRSIECVNLFSDWADADVGSFAEARAERAYEAADCGEL
jgi:Domain of unknown function (DUF4190)